MKAFVTGGTGLLGRHLVAALLDRGWEVTVLTRERARAREFGTRGARIAVGDVTRVDFEPAMVHADVLFHLAGWFEVGARDFRRMFDVNVTGTAAVLAAAKRAEVPRVVVTSAAGILAPEPDGRPVTEASEPKASIRDAYVETKRQAFGLVLAEMHAGAPISMVLPGAVFGPGDTGQLGRSLALLVRGKLNTLPAGFGKNTWTHGADVAEAHLLAATVGRPGQMYVVGDRVLPFAEFLRAAAEAAGVPPPRRFAPMAAVRLAARASELRSRFTGRTPLLSRASLDLAALDLIVDASKAREALGWSPAPFGERLKATMAWFRETYGDASVPLPIKPDGASV